MSVGLIASGVEREVVSSDEPSLAYMYTVHVLYKDNAYRGTYLLKSL